MRILCQAGFQIREFGEPSASAELAQRVPTVADTRVAGLFLHILAGKPELTYR